MVLVLSYPCFLFLIPLFPYELDNKHTERSDLGFHVAFVLFGMLECIRMQFSMMFGKHYVMKVQPSQ